jgi:hypothetical protein
MDLIKLSIYYKNICMTYILYNRCFNKNNTNKNNTNNNTNNTNNTINYNEYYAISSEIIER